MKRIMILVFSLMLLLSSVSCAITSNAGSGTKYEENETAKKTYGLTLTAKDVTSDGLTLVFTQSGGNPTGELMLGVEFALDKYEDGAWKALKTKPDTSWTLQGYTIEKDSVYEMNVRWTWVYGELEKGTYRLRKNITDFRRGGDFDIFPMIVEFKVK